MGFRWSGLIAPTEVPTGDGRMFAAGKMTHRPLPLPLMVRFGSGGHEGATVVGTVNRIFDGPGGYWGEGEFLDPTFVPEVPKAMYLLSKKVMGPSVDLDRDFTVEAIKHPTRIDKRAGKFNEYNVIGITLVPMPAFHQVHLSVDSMDDKALLASVSPDIDLDAWRLASFDVNNDSWKNWPIAPRDFKFDADDAVKRIAYWAGIGGENPDLNRYASVFLWRDGNQAGDTLAQDSFRLPLADIINNQPHLIYHAAYSAAALLSGAHGGLPNIPDQDKQAMVPVIVEIYAALANAFNDPNLRSPFEEDTRPTVIASADSEDCGCSEMSPNVYINIGGEPYPQVATSALGETFNYTGPVTVSAPNMPSLPSSPRRFAEDGKEPYGDVKYADPGYQKDGVKRYPLDSEEHCRAAWAYINMPKNAAKYSPKELKLIKGRIREALEEYDVDVADDGKMSSLEGQSLVASVAPLAPPAAWFQDPKLTEPTQLTVDAKGHVFGHLAQWKVCHVGIGKSCVMAPKSRNQYGYFKVGKVLTDDGSFAQVGKITLGTGHASPHWGIMPSREHYDNTGWSAAIVNVGEDRHGIWVNGALSATMTPERVAELRAAALSGDWREVNGNLELIAALAVNNPGFPIYREQNSRAFSLMAVGIIGQDSEDDGMTEFGGRGRHIMDEDIEDDVEDVEAELIDEDEDGDIDAVDVEEVDEEDDEDEEEDDTFNLNEDGEEYDEEEEDEEEDLEMSQRLARLDDLDAELEAYNQDKRLAQLAALDEREDARSRG